MRVTAGRTWTSGPNATKQVCPSTPPTRTPLDLFALLDHQLVLQPSVDLRGMHYVSAATQAIWVDLR